MPLPEDTYISELTCVVLVQLYFSNNSITLQYNNNTGSLKPAKLFMPMMLLL